MFGKRPAREEKKKPGELALERALYWVRSGNAQKARQEVKNALLELKNHELDGKD